MDPDIIDNTISAQIENKQNPLYDFSAVVKYAKTMEQEIYMFTKALFKKLSDKDKDILNTPYSVQGIDYTLNDIFTHKPNLGTYKFLLKQRNIKSLIEDLDFKIQVYINKIFPNVINGLQNIRNETVHAKAPSKEQIQELRDKIIGVAKESILIQIVKMRVGLINKK